MNRLKKITIKYCKKCKYELKKETDICPNCYNNSFSTEVIYKRLRIERIVFMFFAAIFSTIITFIIVYSITNDFKSESFIAGICVLSLYGASKYWFGLEFSDYYAEKEIPEEAYSKFNWSYFKTEFVYFFIILFGMIIIFIIFRLAGLIPAK